MTPKQFAKSYNKLGSIRAVCARSKTRLTYGAACKLRHAAIEAGLVEPGKPQKTHEERKKPEGRVKAIGTRQFDLPAPGEIRRYLFTCAQNDTLLHDKLWKNLLVIAEHYDADIHVARFLYIKQGLGAQGDKANYTKEKKLYNEVVLWDKRLEPYLSDERAEVAPGLVWCGEMNVLPTAVRPLSGMESYTGRKSGVFPHVKLAMQSIPSAKYEATKFNFTTGTVTQRNYIQRKAGLKAEFHHCYGALLVEVDSDGNWFCRQINADSDGTIHDMDIRVKNRKVTTGNRVEAITWGDIHALRIDTSVRQLGWAPGGMLETLRPKYQFIHDVFDFHTRNHHDRRDHHKMYQKYQKGNDSVEVELGVTATFLDSFARRDWCETIIVESNHDNALERWLRDDPGWYARDPVNAELFLRLQLRKYQSMGCYDGSDDNFLLIEHALRAHGGLQGEYRFLGEDESFVICPDAHGGIEGGMHGHTGPNGARGGANAFAKMGRKSNTGHSHTACIVDGVYVSGTSSVMDLGYNKGPSSWSQTHTVTYPNGKRALYTMWNNKWRA